LQVTWENTRAATAKIILTFVDLGNLTNRAGAIRLSLVRPAFRIVVVFVVVYAIPRSAHAFAQPLIKRRVRARAETRASIDAEAPPVVDASDDSPSA
jgi:hypothetical protein